MTTTIRTFLVLLTIVFITATSEVGNCDTKVGGVIFEDTVWDLEGSPYHVKKRIQIEKDSTLTIEAGVQVHGDFLVGESDMSGRGIIEVGGTLKAEGTESNRVQFHNISIREGSGFKFEMHLNYIKMIMGELRSGSCFAGSLHLKNSILIGPKKELERQTHSRLTNLFFMDLDYPTKDCYIEKNVFINWCKIRVSTREANIYIRNNVFYNGLTFDGTSYAIEIKRINEDVKVVVESNTFLDKDKHAIAYFAHGKKFTATNNYWGTVDTSEIDEMIKDRRDDLDCEGVVVYKPFLTKPHSDTPKLVLP